MEEAHQNMIQIPQSSQLAMGIWCRSFALNYAVDLGGPSSPWTGFKPPNPYSNYLHFPFYSSGKLRDIGLLKADNIIGDAFYMEIDEPFTLFVETLLFTALCRVAVIL